MVHVNGNIAHNALSTILELNCYRRSGKVFKFVPHFHNTICTLQVLQFPEFQLLYFLEFFWKE
jgi:hypothetical protein